MGGGSYSTLGQLAPAWVTDGRKLFVVLFWTEKKTRIASSDSSSESASDSCKKRKKRAVVSRARPQLPRPPTPPVISHAGPASQLPTPPVPVVFRAGPAPLVFHAGPAPQPPTPPPASTSGSEPCKMTVSETFHSTSSLLCCSVNFYFIIFYCQFCHSFYVFPCVFSIKLCACSFHIISVSINNFFISPFPFTGNCNVMLCFIQCHSFSQFLSCT